MPAPAEVLASVGSRRGCKLVTTPEEWNAIQTTGHPPKTKKPLECPESDFAISYLGIVHDGRTKIYGPRDCSGVSAFTNDAEPGTERYSISFSIRNTSKKSTRVSGSAKKGFPYWRRGRGCGPVWPAPLAAPCSSA